MSASNRIHDSWLMARLRTSVSARRDGAVIACWDALLLRDLATARAVSPSSFPIIQQLSALDDTLSPTSAFLDQLEQELVSATASPSRSAKTGERRPVVALAPQITLVSHSKPVFSPAVRWPRFGQLLVPVSIVLVALLLVGIWQRDRLLPATQPTIPAPLASGALPSNGGPVQTLAELTFDPNSIDSAMPSSVVYIEVDVQGLGPGETATIGADGQHGVNGFLVLDGLIEVGSPSAAIVRTKDGQTILIEAGRQRTLASGDMWIGAPDEVSPITTFSDAPSRYLFFYVGSQTGPGGAVVAGTAIHGEGYGYRFLQMTYGGGPLTLQIDRLAILKGQTAQLELANQEIGIFISPTGIMAKLNDGTPATESLAYSGYLLGPESPRTYTVTASGDGPTETYLIRIRGLTSTASTPLALESGPSR
jgi:hypothetical protein